MVIEKVLGTFKGRIEIEDAEEKTINNSGFDASTSTVHWRSQIFFYTDSKFCQFSLFIRRGQDAVNELIELPAGHLHTQEICILG